MGIFVERPGGDHVLVQVDSEAWLGGQLIEPVRNLERLLLHLVVPGHVTRGLQDHKVRYGRAELNAGGACDGSVGIVRRHKDVLCLSGRRDSPQFGDAPGMADVGLDHIDQPSRNQVLVSPAEVEPLAGRELRVEACVADELERVQVLRRYRLLEEPHVEIFDCRDLFDRDRRARAAVVVDHDVDVRPDLPAHF